MRERNVAFSSGLGLFCDSGESHEDHMYNNGESYIKNTLKYLIQSKLYLQTGMCM